MTKLRHYHVSVEKWKRQRERSYIFFSASNLLFINTLQRSDGKDTPLSFFPKTAQSTLLSFEFTFPGLWKRMGAHNVEQRRQKSIVSGITLFTYAHASYRFWALYINWRIYSLYEMKCTVLVCNAIPFTKFWKLSSCFHNCKNFCNFCTWKNVQNSDHGKGSFFQNFHFTHD